MKIVVVAKLKAKEGKFDDLKKYLADKFAEDLIYKGKPGESLVEMLIEKSKTCISSFEKSVC